MYIYLFMLSIPIIALTIYKEKNFYNPTTVFVGLWTMITMLSVIRAYGLAETSDRAYFLVLIGLISFFGGVCFRNRWKVTLGAHKLIDTSGNYDIKYGFLIIWFALVLVLTAMLATKSISLIMHGTPMSYIRNNYRNMEAGIVINSSFSYYTEQYFVAPSEFAAVALFPIILFSEKNRKKKYLVLEIIVFLVLHIFVTGARSFLIDVVVVMFFYVLINRDLRKRYVEYFKRIPKILYIIICVGLIGVVVFVSQLRKGDEVSFVREIYMYFSISYPLFDTHINLMDASPQFTYGMTFFNGALRPFILVLRKLGLPYPDLYRLASTLISDNNLYYSVGETRANSLVSTFYSFYMDFGAIGIIIGSFIYGYVAQSAYISLKNNPCKRNQALYLLMALGLFLSFVKFQFIGYRYLYAFFIIFIAFKRNYSEIDGYSFK